MGADEDAMRQVDLYGAPRAAQGKQPPMSAGGGAALSLTPCADAPATQPRGRR
jgi:hypothetical protein